MTKFISGTELTGPRVYFTNLDHSFSDDRFAQGIPALKLQALLKRNIIVAASSLFDEKWFRLVRDDSGLQELLNSGVIIPAIRDEYTSVGDFFAAKPHYSPGAMDFYGGAVSNALRWSLRDTTDWFADKLVSSIGDSQSITRQIFGLPENSIEHLINEIHESRSVSGILTREAAITILAKSPMADQTGMQGFVDLLYGISGAKAVNSEGHFPQFLFDFEFPNAAARLDDDTVFWDYFIGGIMEGLNTLCRLDPKRIAALSFSEILAIRRGVAFEAFSDKFDKLTALAKASVPIHDEDQLILNCSETLTIGSALKSVFFEEVGRELEAQRVRSSVSGYYETTNTIVSIGSLLAGGPIVGAVGGAFGLLSSFNSSPVAARIFGPATQAKIERCVAVVKNRIARMSGLPSSDRTALLEMYRNLVLHGLG